jgi:maleylpyruvate isomerase
VKLYTFHQSGSAYRVRIALNLKRIDYEPIFVRGGPGSQELRSAGYLRVNPQGVVPALEHDGRILTQSTSIIEYLEEIVPTPSLLPGRPSDRARVRALAQLVVSDIHPLITARVTEFLAGELELPRERQQHWLRHWHLRGLRALETLLAGHPDTGRYCHGDQPTLADVCLVPQMYTARRMNCDLSGLPTIQRIDAECSTHPAFQRAAPEHQADAPTP